LADATVLQLIDYEQKFRHDSLSSFVLHQAKRRVVDTIGCAYGALDAPPVRIAREMAVSVNGAFSARVIGSLMRTTPELAAFANGVMLRYLDFNDSSLGGNRGGHPSDNLASVLAVAEAVGASGRDFLLALTLCYEIQCRIADSAPFNDKGWDQPVAGIIGVAVACGRLLKLNREQMEHAISLAIIPNFCSYQTRIGQISMWKGCAGANGGRQGVFAAVLASKGMTGPSDPINGKFGFWALTVGRPYDIEPFATSGDDFAIALSAMKKHPVRTFGQIMVDTALDLRKKIEGRDIATLRIRTFHASYKVKESEWPESWSATTRETADHSLLFAVIVTLLDGQLTPDSYERERFLDKDVHDLIKRTKLELVEAFDKDYEQGIRNCVLEATTATGETVSSHLTVTPADIKRGPSDSDIEEKFGRLTEKALRSEQRRALLDVLWDLENVPNVALAVDRMVRLNP